MTRPGPPTGSPFSIAAYRQLWFVNLACNTAIFLQSVGAAWALVENGASPQEVALVQTALSLPMVLISPLSGAIADSVDRRKIMIASQMVLTVVAAALAASSTMNVASAPVVLGCMFVSGCSLAFIGPAFMASISDTVPRDRLADAVLANSVGLNVARSIGPALGGAILAAAGVFFNFLSAGVVAVILIALLWRWQPAIRPCRPDGASEPIIGAISSGFRYAMQTRPVRSAMLQAVLFASAFSMVPALMPLIASILLGGGPDLYGLLFGVYGLGALAGALSGARLRRFLSFTMIVRGCIVLSIGAAIAIALSRNIIITGLAAAVAGAASVIAFAIFNTTIQMASPRRVGGRTLAFYQMAVFLGIAFGSWISGIAAGMFSVSDAFLLMAMLGALPLIANTLAPATRIIHDQAEF